MGPVKETPREQILRLFRELNERIGSINSGLRKSGLRTVAKAEVRLLGQISLLVHEKVGAQLSLAQTGDMDALLRMESVIKKELKQLLGKNGYFYDEDSDLIWIPPGATFETLLDLDRLVVKSIDPESALVSKAVKAPQKNKQLIREAIAV
ncbi:MAG TPA: hypothetical protein VL588_10170 [Bdellovibrionota bacterium]|nr:hypothetical protein [Bdellovibrionota bacterium]